jgi:hypothetical protein
MREISGLVVTEANDANMPRKGSLVPARSNSTWQKYSEMH